MRRSAPMSKTSSGIAKVISVLTGGTNCSEKKVKCVVSGAMVSPTATVVTP